MDNGDVKIFAKGAILPLLVAVYPIIFLYTHNVQELVLSQLYLPIATATVGTLAAWVVISFSLKDPIKAGIITTVFLVCFFAYGTIFDWFSSLNLFDVKHRHLLPLVLFVGCYVGYFITKIRNQNILQNSSKYLLIILLALLVVNIVTIIPWEIEKCRYDSNSGTETVRHDAIENSRYPDVYYIVLDEYAHFDTIKSTWGYNNSEFADFLEDEGFFVAYNSKAISTDTLTVTASNLNMREIDPSTSTLERFSLINNNSVMNYFSHKGYTVVVFDGIKVAYPNKGPIQAHYNYEYPQEGYNDDPSREEGINSILETNDFLQLIIDRTALSAFSYAFDGATANCPDRRLDWHRQERLHVFKSLTKVDEVQSPKFIFAHILLPHAPFIFDEYGNTVDPENSGNWDDREYYKEQYIFTTKMAQKIIKTIIERSEVTPIIIIQSDHGPRASTAKILSIPEEDSQKVLNALLLPSYDYDELTDNISPIETFPLIIKHYFNETVFQECDRPWQTN